MGALVLGSILQAACLGIPEHQELREPSRSLPGDYAAAAGVPQGASETVAPGQPAAPAELQPREGFFTDPPLQALIQAALDSNQELNIRVQEILIAQNEVLARSGEYRPRVGVGAGAGVEKVGETTSQGASDEADGVPENLPDFNVGLLASWRSTSGNACATWKPSLPSSTWPASRAGISWSRA